MRAVSNVEDDIILALNFEGVTIQLGREVCATADTASSAIRAAASTGLGLILGFLARDGSTMQKLRRLSGE